MEKADIISYIVLQKFCVILRQSVSKENAKVFSNNFGFQVRNQIKSRLGFG